MNTEERAAAFAKFNTCIDGYKKGKMGLNNEGLSLKDIRDDNLPEIEVVSELMQYHRDITSTIEGTFLRVQDVIVNINELKNRKRNIQKMMDVMTSIIEIKKLSYGLGTEASEIYKSLETYYSIKGKVCYVDKFIQKIETQISEIEKKYKAQFNVQLSKTNSANISQVSKVLQLIGKNTGQNSSLNPLEQLVDYYCIMAKKQFKRIEDDLFAIPIVGNGEANYVFFDLSKDAMKVVVNIVNTYKGNIVKLCGIEGFHVLVVRLFELVSTNIILEILVRVRRYYEVDKININQSGKLALKDRQNKILKPFFKEFNAIWNQVQRLKHHLLDQFSSEYSKYHDLKKDFQNILNTHSFIQINTSVITFMQANMRYNFDKLLKNSPFVNNICLLDPNFFKKLNTKESLAHNPEAQDFLQETVNRVIAGIEKSLETLNMLIVSAIVNSANHSLIYEDVFYAFNELFNRCFSKMPTSDTKPLTGLILVLNTVSTFPFALKNLMSIKVPQKVNNERFRAEIQQLIGNNEEKTRQYLKQLLLRIVNAEWFRNQILQDYTKVIDRWQSLQSNFFGFFVQEVCRVHAEILLSTEFEKKYNQVGVINLEKQVREIVNYYQKYSHSILPNFKNVFDFIDVLMVEDEQDFRRIAKRYEGVYSIDKLKKIWSLKV